MGVWCRHTLPITPAHRLGASAPPPPTVAAREAVVAGGPPGAHLGVKGHTAGAHLA